MKLNNKYNEKESSHEHSKTNARPVATSACQQAIWTKVDANRTTKWSQDIITCSPYFDEASARVQQPITTSMDALSHEQQRTWITQEAVIASCDAVFQHQNKHNCIGLDETYNKH